MAADLRPSDRIWFKRCRRSWDLGSRLRRGLEPAERRYALDLDRAVRDGLAVYYFPGMWEWDRKVVLPLAFAAFEKSLQRQREGHELTPAEDEQWRGALIVGQQLLDHYLAWAPAVDRFWPVRVETDFDVQVPDPAAAGADLVSPGGEPVRYGDRVDLLLVDEHDAYWVARHRLVERFTEPELLILDDELVAACWAWELFYLGMRISGTIHNELRLGGEPPDPAEPVGRPRGSHAFARARAQHRRMYAQAEHVPSEIVTEEGGGMFRRTRIPRSRAALDDLGRRLATEAVEMLDPALTLYPAPAPEHCGACDFRAPCLALNEGADAEAVLAAGYRPRPPETPEEGRLGAVTWSMNRGAAPPPQWRNRDRRA
ncbi:MAG TPA: hypothetical protein VJ456_02890 [Acidimicrobiia bacterium]|nr:hypothetical protein [Acidimicrobiia bacterium]